LGLGFRESVFAFHQNAPRAAARASGVLHLSETAYLHLVSHQGSQILHEEGRATGTLRGPLTAVITIAYTQATVSFTAHPPGGTLSGRGVESYYVSGKKGHFSGRMTITGGTGAYRRATSRELHTTGVINRAHYEVQMSVNGELRR
jgi:hypothetical protein